MNPTIQAIADKSCKLVTQGEELLTALENYGWPDTRPEREDEHVEDSVTAEDILDDYEQALIPASVRIPFELLAQHDKWYAGCLGLINANMVSRSPELIVASGPAHRILSSDYMTFEDQLTLARCIRRVNAIVSPVPDYLDGKLRDVQLAVAAEYVDDELAEADVLNEAGHVRAAGALAGVLLERHLKFLCNQHEPPVGYDKQDGISKLNDKLKTAQVYSIVQWRKIQWMSDIRNTCDHANTSDPRREDVSDMIAGVRKLVALLPSVLDQALRGEL